MVAPKHLLHRSSGPPLTLVAERRRLDNCLRLPKCGSNDLLTEWLNKVLVGFTADRRRLCLPTGEDEVVDEEVERTKQERWTAEGGDGIESVAKTQTGRRRRIAFHLPSSVGIQVPADLWLLMLAAGWCG